MDQEKEKFLNLKNPPARLNSEQTAWYLGFATHDISILISKGLLKPLGRPKENSIKYFAVGTLQELRLDIKWLGRASDVIAEHWRTKNLRKARRERGLEQQAQLAENLN